jgi:hypothetical protein
VKGIQVCSNKGPGPSQRGDNYKNTNMGWGHLKFFFTRTTGPIITRLDTNHPWGKGIKVSSNEWESSSPRGDNSKKSKNTLKLNKKKIFFSRTSRPNSMKLITNYQWVKGIQICSNKGPGPFQRGDIYKNVKMGTWGHLKIFSRTTWPILTRLGTKYPWVKGIHDSSNEGDSSSPRGYNGKRVKIH